MISPSDPQDESSIIDPHPFSNYSTVMAETKQTIWKRLQRFFRVGVTTRSGGGGFGQSQQQVTPLRHDPAKGSGDNVAPVNFPQPFRKLYDWWLNQCHDSRESFEERRKRVKDIEYMVKNEEIISMAADTIADETISSESEEAVITVDAASAAIRNRIQDLLQQWGHTPEKLRDKAYNVATFGDHFDANTVFLKHGITDVTPLDILAVSDRVEFSLKDMAQKKREYQGFFNQLMQQDTRLGDLTKMLDLDATDDYTALFKSYLFGFKLFDDSITLPPWGISHYRLYSSNSEFAPFGRSVFINSISPFRQLKASMNLMAIGRMSKLPREMFEVDTDESMSEMEKWEQVNAVRQNFHAINRDTAEEDDLSIDTRFWYAKDLLNYRVEETRMNMDDIADIEFLRDNLIMGTRIPKGYLIVDRASFGTSGQALLRQFKPFGRLVYAVQTAVLEEIANQIRTHFTITGEFDGADTEFTLSMPYPVVEESRDQMQMKNDSIRLANDIIGNIQSALGTRDGLPPEVVKSVFSQISFLDPEDVDAWLNQSAEALGLNEEEGQRNHSHLPLVNRRMETDQKIKLRNRLSEDLLNHVTMKALHENGFSEGTMNGKHYYSAWTKDGRQDKIYEILRRPPSGKLVEKHEKLYKALHG